MKYHKVMEGNILTQVLLPIALFIIMLGMGLSLVINDFKRVMIYPKAVMIGLVNQLLLLPIIAFFIAGLWEWSGALAVGLNSDLWLSKKKGQPFMPFDDRLSIVRSLEMVDNVLEFDDINGTACDAIAQCLEIYDKVIFANGGDRHNENTPEFNLYKDDDRVIYRWGVGGIGKKQSSSWILETWDERDR